MRNYYLIGALAVAAMTLFSCMKEQEEIAPDTISNGIPFEISAGSYELKTTNTGKTVKWAVGDQLAVWHAETTTSSYVADGSFEAATAAASSSFSGTLDSALDPAKSYDWYAVYPYVSGPNNPGSFDYITIGCAASATQEQSGYNNDAHLSGAAFPLYGKLTGVAADTSPAISMKHIASAIEFNVTNKCGEIINIEQIQFTSSASDASKLIGTYRLSFSDGSATLTPATNNSVATLDVVDPVDLANNESAKFYMAIRPFSVAVGETLTIVVKTDKGTQTLSNVATSSFTFVAGKIHTLNINYTNKAVSLAQFKYNDTSWLEAQSITLPSAGGDTNLNGAPQTVSPITITPTDGGTKTRVHCTSGSPNTYDLRVYKNGGSLTVTSTSSYIINKVTFVGSGLSAAKLSADSGTYTEGITTWTGFAQDVKFTASDTWTIKSINVFYQPATLSDHILIVPVKEFDAAYTAGSVDFSIKQLNIDDLVVSSTSPGYTDYSVVGNTVTVNYSANATTSPRDIVVSVSSSKAGVDETVTITQAGAPASVSTLVYNTPGTVTAQIAAHCTKGFILADNTGAILVYTNSNTSSTYSIGQTMTVGGTIGHYNKGLQFPTEATITPGATGSYAYPSPTTYTKTEIDAWNADEADRFASYVTLTGVIKKNGSNYDIIVGGGSTANVTLYYPLSSFTSGLAEGDNVTITGYAMSVMSSKCGVIPTEVVNNETTPKIVYSNITGVTGNAASGLTVNGTAFRTTGWSTEVSFTGCVNSASINAACTTITYGVSLNETGAVRAGTITVTFKKDGHADVPYVINVSQAVAGSTQVFDMTDASYASSSADLVTWTSTPFTLTVSKNGSSYDANAYLGGDGSNAHTRLYNKHIITITPASGKNILSITFVTTGSTYATNLNNGTWTNASHSISGNNVIATPTTGTNAVSVQLGTTTRLTSVSILYTE